MQNAFIELFNGRLRDECLNEALFSSLRDARTELAKWTEDYNKHRPHSALDNITPAEFALKKRLHETTFKTRDSPLNRREVGSHVRTPILLRNLDTLFLKMILCLFLSLKACCLSLLQRPILIGDLLMRKLLAHRETLTTCQRDISLLLWLLISVGPEN